MAEEPTATARFRAELTGAWAEFLASLFFVFFGAGSVCGAVKAVGEPVVVEPINYAASFGRPRSRRRPRRLPRRSGGSASSWTRRRWSRATRCSTYERFDTALNDLTEN